MRCTHAVILAAGVGRRLGAAHCSRPKCLLSFAGASLLQRQLAMLNSAGVQRATLVTGHRRVQIEEALADIRPCLVPDMVLTTLFNPAYRSGSAMSCLAAAPALCSGDAIMLMDADVLCDARMIDRLLTSPHANCLLVDRAFVPGDEPVTLAARGGHPVGFGKRLAAEVMGATVGESVGFFRLTPAIAQALAHRCSHYERTGDIEAPYEHPLRDVMLAHSRAFGYEDITGLPWIEIDFSDDVQRAQTRVLPRLRDMPVLS